MDQCPPTVTKAEREGGVEQPLLLVVGCTEMPLILAIGWPFLSFFVVFFSVFSLFSISCSIDPRAGPNATHHQSLARERKASMARRWMQTAFASAHRCTRIRFCFGKDRDGRAQGGWTSAQKKVMKSSSLQLRPVHSAHSAMFSLACRFEAQPTNRWGTNRTYWLFSVTLSPTATVGAGASKSANAASFLGYDVGRGCDGPW